MPVTRISLRLGGQDYVVSGADEARLDASRSLSGLSLRLRVDGALEGPCWRCLEPASVPISIDAREFVAAGRDPDAPYEEGLDSVYVDDDRVDVALWVRDAFAEAVPPTILCRADCAGLCATCGADLNAGDCGCTTERTDPRWGPLRDIAERMDLDGDGR